MAISCHLLSVPFTRAPRTASKPYPRMDGQSLPSSVHVPSAPTDVLPHDRNSDRIYEASLLLISFLWATVIAYLLLQKLPLRTFSWPALLLKSIEYLALTVVAGISGIRLTCWLRSQQPVRPLLQLYRAAAAGWIFLPCLAVLYTLKSSLLIVTLAFATAITALSLRTLFPVRAEEVRPRSPGPLPTLDGLPPADSPLLQAFFVAMCAQASLLFALRESLFLAIVCVVLAVSVLIWRWSASDITLGRRLAGDRAAAMLGLFALLLTVFTLTPFFRVFGAASGFNPVPRKPPAARQPGQLERSGTDYAGIILLPPPARKVEILPPTPHAHSTNPGHAAEPTIVPFDGPYWYFRPPTTQPGANAHVAHGKPTDPNVNPRSTDFLPLRMEAHQNLGLPIDLSCCSEIDIDLLNADTHLGAIGVGLFLSDAGTPAAAPQDLGQKPLLSSQDAPIPTHRPPVPETLRFLIPVSAHITRFDRITVVFYPSKERTRLGAKVSIQNFKLIPR